MNIYNTNENISVQWESTINDSNQYINQVQNTVKMILDNNDIDKLIYDLHYEHNTISIEDNHSFIWSNLDLWLIDIHQVRDWKYIVWSLISRTWYKISELISLNTINGYRQWTNLPEYPWLWSILIEKYIEDCKSNNIKTITLMSRNNTIGFYQKVFQELVSEWNIDSFTQSWSWFYINI